MKKVFSTMLSLFFVTVIFGQAQSEKEFNIAAAGITDLDVSVAWGSITIVPSHQLTDIKVSVNYDNYEKKDLESGLNKLQSNRVGHKLVIKSPVPIDGKFESYNLSIAVPASLNLKLSIERGGDVFVKGINGIIEADNQNGSTKIEEASSLVTANNFNGEINVSYSDISSVKAISLISFNGGIKLMLPETPGADVVLQTKKNGWISSDFAVKMASGAFYQNMEKGKYVTGNTQWNGRIENGGVKIIAITNNGPIELLKLPPRSVSASKARLLSLSR